MQLVTMETPMISLFVRSILVLLGSRWHQAVALAAPFVMLMVAASSCLRPTSAPGEQQRREAFYSLQSACVSLLIAITDKPAGGGCTSMAEAAREVTGTTKVFPWQNTSDRQSIMYLNPDWNKWHLATAKGSPVDGELAAFCKPTITASNGGFKAYIGITFGEKIGGMRAAPEWPPATNWLVESHFVPAQIDERRNSAQL